MKLLQLIKYKLWLFLGGNIVFLKVLNIYIKLTKKEVGIVDNETELVIEGFPRSANTFSYVAFKISQKENIKIAHHIHGPAQILFALKNKIPVLLLIRKPYDAISSLILRQPFIPIKLAIQQYIRFYTKLIPYKKQIVIGEFNDVVNNFNKIINKLNRKYCKSYLSFDYSQKNLQKCYNIIDAMDKKDRKNKNVDKLSVARPIKEKKFFKEEIIKELNENYKNLMEEAEKIYNQFIS